MLQLAQPHYVIQHSIVSSSSTSLQGIYDVVTLQMHIMCQDLQALHLKCFLCQSNNLMCSHFKANPRPGLKYITVADITLHINMFSVYYYQVLRCSRNVLLLTFYSLRELLRYPREKSINAIVYIYACVCAHARMPHTYCTLLHSP